jgi:hypothetical protein
MMLQHSVSLMAGVAKSTGLQKAHKNTFKRFLDGLNKTATHSASSNITLKKIVANAYEITF